MIASTLSAALLAGACARRIRRPARARRDALAPAACLRPSRLLVGVALQRDH